MADERALPEAAPFGSFHVLHAPDGRCCIGRFEFEGWVIYRLVGEPMSAAAANAEGYMLVASTIEGGPVLSWD